ncbi:protein CASC3-like [Polyodon spathula]|uniref:protein CASC3-like n=1 Tax=Polyodon spathula TaxID=7913 RepID=UPI001B7DBD70|nr:protein CASC3-like [Polyodon spathula]
MADRRRKRASQDSEDESGSGTESAGSGPASAENRAGVPEPVVALLPPQSSARVKAARQGESECESEDGIEGDAVLSDYESAEENGSRSEQGEGAEEEEEEEEEVTEATLNKEVKSEGKEKTLEGERQSGDGQESTESPESKPEDEPGKKLDDDEDRQNPAYIPRKGLFFEHDVRGAAQEEDMRPKGRQKKLWKDEGRWVHDKFREDEQAPKSREELVSVYGYDIRHPSGPSDLRPQRSRKPRYSVSPPAERWSESEKPNRSQWQSSTSGNITNHHHPPPPSPQPQHGAPQSSRPYGGVRNSTGGSGRVAQQQPRTFQNCRAARSNSPSSPYSPHREERTTARLVEQQSNRERERARNSSNSQRARSEFQPRQHSPSVVVEEYRNEGNEEEEEEYSRQSQERDFPAQSRRREEEKEEVTVHTDMVFPARDRDGPSPSPLPLAPAAPERTVEKKSYSRARRTRNKALEIGKQGSVEETLPPPQPGGAQPDSPAQVPPPQMAQLTPPGVKAESWEPPLEGSGGGLEHEMSRMNLGAHESWTPSQPPYIPGEMRGISSQMPLGASHQYGRINDMGVGRAKRYSSQRQRPVPDPTAMHIGIMEGHYYDPLPFQGPIYAHNESPAPLPPQGMMVQPEMHLTHPGLPPAPLPNPGLYATPPGQPPPGPLLAPTYYSPPGVMTFSNTNFSYPAGATLPPMYPNPQVYGGVTYYSTVQQQAQSIPSPPRRTSQPVSIKPPPPEVRHLLPE